MYDLKITYSKNIISKAVQLASVKWDFLNNFLILIYLDILPLISF